MATKEEIEVDEEKLKKENGTASKDEELSQEDLIKKQIQAGIDEALKPIKQNLDKAYAQRDEAKAKLEEIEQKRREAELERLKEEGKHKEAFDIELKNEREKREALEKKNIELTRDITLKGALSTLDFRNERAMKMATVEIVDQLVRDERGEWVHKSGVSINDFVKTFAETESNEFLFKQKLNSGGGGSKVKDGDFKSQPKSLFEMSQADVLKLAAEGKLPSR